MKSKQLLKKQIKKLKKIMNKYHEKDAELKLMELLLDIYSNKEIFKRFKIII